MMPRQIMGQRQSSESAWQRGTFLGRRYFLPDKWHYSAVFITPPPSLQKSPPWLRMVQCFAPKRPIDASLWHSFTTFAVVS